MPDRSERTASDGEGRARGRRGAVAVLVASAAVGVLVGLWAWRAGPRGGAGPGGGRPAASSGEVVAGLDRQCGAGDATACVTLGALHQQGRGVPRDPVRARAAYDRACSLGEAIGCLLRDGLPASPPSGPAAPPPLE